LVTLGTPAEAVEARLTALATGAALPETVADGPQRLVEALPPLQLERPARPAWPTLAALAIVTGLVALGLGAWAVASEMRSAEDSFAGPTADRSLTVLTDAAAERYPLRGSVNRIVLVVAGDGRAVLALDGLGPPPQGSAYRAWLVPPGTATPVAVAEFDATTPAVPLARAVEKGARVAVTLEPVPGATAPTRRLRLVALRA
jgi:anti-sigma-K factor RskA